MQDGLTELQGVATFRGLYIDHDEPAAFCSGEDDGTTQCGGFIPIIPKVEEKPKTLVDKVYDFFSVSTIADRQWYYINDQQEEESTYNLPFNPGDIPLDYQTVSLNATHPSTGETEYNMHNLYGHSMAKAVHSYWDEMEMRPMSLLRSTFPGSGQYG
jgi:alpha-glucosidase (family GH31 glycosyl hydrolase)